MKKLLLLVLLSSLLFGCGERTKSQLPKFKYKVGDVVYLKPDSTKAVIDDINPNSGSYSLYYFDKLGQQHYEPFVAPSRIY